MPKPGKQNPVPSICSHRPVPFLQVPNTASLELHPAAHSPPDLPCKYCPCPCHLPVEQPSLLPLRYASPMWPPSQLPLHCVCGPCISALTDNLKDKCREQYIRGELSKALNDTRTSATRKERPRNTRQTEAFSQRHRPLVGAGRGRGCRSGCRLHSSHYSSTG